MLFCPELDFSGQARDFFAQDRGGVKFVLSQNKTLNGELSYVCSGAAFYQKKCFFPGPVFLRKKAPARGFQASNRGRKFYGVDFPNGKGPRLVPAFKKAC